MANRVVLHIGAMKSGTSFLQNVLGDNRDELARQGFCFPGKRWRRQVSAVRDVSERGLPGQPPLAEDGPWNQLVREVDAWDGTALVSMEFLGPRMPPKIEQIVSSFSTDRVEAVMTVRDLARSVPAMWQEAMQNAGVSGWEDYLEAVRTENRKHPGGRNFWRHQATGAIADRWSKGVGKDRFTLVTVPPPGAPPTLLWERFAQAVGLDPEPFDLATRRSNPSIGAASALVLRALNERLADDPLPRNIYSRYVKHALAKEGLARREADDPMFGIDEPWVAKFAEREVRRLRKLDLRVIGSLDDLAPRPVRGVPAGSVTTEQQLEAALDGLARVVRLWATPKRKGVDALDDPEGYDDGDDA
ncbi:hypothetical protein [Nocardioides caldifontis]|uniref:hypothetical protein n=1 Tax=Nocardioides caldifontis TaxID=2588938 RepID=UPI0011DFCB43|nr:hypothetical protein [Nocardioides caldifontis]